MYYVKIDGNKKLSPISIAQLVVTKGIICKDSGFEL